MTEFLEKTETTNYVQSGASWLIGKVMSESELATALGVPVSTVKRLRYEGKIPYAKIGKGRPVYLAESVYAWLKLKEVHESVHTLSGKAQE